MARREAKAYEVQGYKLVCPVCGHDLFWTRRSLLNTATATFFNLDWANREANNLSANAAATSCGSSAANLLHPGRLARSEGILPSSR